MAVEPRRGCGYRKIGGLYLVSGGRGVYCDRLPMPLDICPTCGHEIKQTRGWTWVQPTLFAHQANSLVGGVHPECTDDFPCPLCMFPHKLGRCGLLWIGEQFYATPREFNCEAEILGISRRIARIPRGFQVGETWILFAHPKTVETFVEVETDSGAQGEFPVTALESRRIWKPGIFKVWRPERIEKILPESARGSAEAAELVTKGITPVFVPDQDPDHGGNHNGEENSDE